MQIAPWRQRISERKYWGQFTLHRPMFTKSCGNWGASLHGLRPTCDELASLTHPAGISIFELRVSILQCIVLRSIYRYTFKDARSSQVGLRPWRLAPQFPHEFVYMGLWGVNWPQHFRSLIRCLHGAICVQRHDI